MKSSRRRAFTLVELLIAIVVVGVLAAMMMLSSTEAVSSAKAAKIISDMRKLKTAAISWYTDNMDMIDPTCPSPYGIKVGPNKWEDIQTYFTGYQVPVIKNGEIIGYKTSGTAYNNQSSLRKYMNGGDELRINPSNRQGQLCTEQVGDIALKNGSNITGNNNNNNKNWFVVYRVADEDTDNISLQNKLKSRAASAGLLGTNGSKTFPYNGGRLVLMHVLKFAD